MYSYEKQNVNRSAEVNNFGAKAIAAAYKAVNADPNNAMAYQYLAIAKFHEGDHEGFRKAARISLNLNPNDAEVLADIGGHFIQLDNSEEGRLMVEKAMSLSPGHPPWYHASLAVYYYARYESAKAIHHARQYTQETSLSSYILLTASLAQGNHIPEAQETYQKLLQKRPVFASDYHQILSNWPLPSGVTQMIHADLIKSGLKETVVSLDNKRASVTQFPGQAS
ncbi:hypothetical protein KAR91_81210 [Candidatus Pacearchaeota archaeon]|nr:hypothetical protein [Candidatus Pacearchaeota archaeon]